MIKWAGWILVILGAAHTLIALAVTAPEHADAWFGREIWGQDLAAMSPANGAYWLTLGSFGIPTLLIGATILWLDRRGIVPPQFIAWTLGATSLLDVWIYGPAPHLNLLAAPLLLIGARRAARRTDPAVAPSRA